MNEDIGPLLHGVSNELDRVSSQVLKGRLGISLSQFRVLLALQSRSGMTQKDIAVALNQTEASISRQIKILTNKQLVSVQRNPGNRREHSILLGEKGGNAVLIGTEALNEHYAPLFTHLSEQDQIQLSQALQKIQDHLS